MKDSFGRDIFAEKIVDEILSKYENELKEYKKNPDYKRENIVFAISGKWGEGKTFLLKEIELIAKEKDFNIVSFDPWKYTQEEIAIKRSFLKELNDQLFSNCDLNNLYSDNSETIIDQKKVIKYIIGSYAAYILFLIFLPAIEEILPNITSFLQFLLPLGVISLLISTFSINRKSSAISTSDEFEEKFKDIIKDKTKILCLIDNLDRCEPSSVKKILDSLKTFMCNEECSYIITGDHTVIEKYVGNNLYIDEKPDENSNKTQEGRRFIKKLFDVYWRLPVPTAKQFKKFIEDKIKESKIKFISDESKNNLTVMLDDDSLFERNPRHIIRFITKLRFTLETIKIQLNQLEKNPDDLANKDLKDIINNPDLFAKVLLIEEFFYDLYSFFVLHPDKYVLIEKFVKDGKTIDDVKVIIEDKKIQECLVNEYEKFIKFINWQPQFTDKDKNEIHEVNAFFTFSGSTGLPGNMGPDENNFIEWLKNGQLIEKLGGIIENGTSKEKNITFVKKAIETFDQCSDEEKINVINQSLDLCFRSNEWLDNFDKWIDKWFNNYSDNEDLYQKIIKLIIKNNKFLLIEDLYNKNNVFFNKYFWSNYSEDSLETKEIDGVLSGISKNVYENEIQDILYLKEYFNFNSNYKLELNKIIKTIDNCKDLILKCIDSNLLDSEICIYTFEKLTNFLNTVDCIDWIIENKDLFDNKQDILKKITIQVLGKASNKDDFIRLLNVKDILNQDNIYEILNERINKFIKDSDDLSILYIDKISSKLNKGEKLNIIDTLIDNFFKEKNEKQRKILKILMATSDFFKDSGINTDDMRPKIVKINYAPKGFVIKDLVTVNLRKEMRNSWGI